jgi:hypothetical protein
MVAAALDRKCNLYSIPTNQEAISVLFRYVATCRRCRAFSRTTPASAVRNSGSLSDQCSTGLRRDSNPRAARRAPIPFSPVSSPTRNLRRFIVVAGVAVRRLNRRLFSRCARGLHRLAPLMIGAWC